MPALNFSAEEILPELLKFFDTEGKEGKNQTIRILKEEIPDTPEDTYYEDAMGADFHKKPRLKVGDEVTLYWKQRTSPKDSWFCRRCGALKYSGKLMYGMVVIEKTKPECDCGVRYDFPQKLGKVKITEVFEIDMDNHNIKSTSGWRGEKINILARMDGFKNASFMFRWFDKQYDLSTPKRFAVYRWEWIK